MILFIRANQRKKTHARSMQHTFAYISYTYRARPVSVGGVAAALPVYRSRASMCDAGWQHHKRAQKNAGEKT